MQWKPDEVIKLIALIGALVLAVVGALMMYHGVAADGTIDIRSSILTGSLKTGSAGLCVAFLGIMLASFVILTIGKHKPEALTAARKGVQGKSSDKIGRGALLLGVVTILAAVGANLWNAPGLSFLAVMSGMAFLGAAGAWLHFLGAGD